MIPSPACGWAGCLHAADELWRAADDGFAPARRAGAMAIAAFFFAIPTAKQALERVRSRP